MITIDSDYTERKMTLLVSYEFYDDFSARDIIMRERVSVVVLGGKIATAEHYGYTLPDFVMDEIDSAVGMQCNHIIVFENPGYDPYLPENLQDKDRYIRQLVRAGA